MIWRTEPGGISAIKFEAARLLFSNDVFVAVAVDNRELKQRRFWATYVNRKWGFLSFYMPWHYQIFLLTFFSLLKMISPRVLTKPLPNDAKSPLPVDVRRSKTLLHKLPPLKLPAVTAFWGLCCCLELETGPPFVHSAWSSQMQMSSGLQGKDKRAV